MTQAPRHRHPAFDKGIACFNAAGFFEAHEHLEDAWRAVPAAQGPEKLFVQGLVQVAVAFHHYSTGNRIGARSVLERAVRNLTQNAAHCGGLEIEDLLASLQRWQMALAEDTSTSLPFPVLTIKEE